MKKLNKPTTMLVAFAIAAAMTGCGNDDEPIKDLGGGIYEFNGHTFVDLGLPSGLLWADRNVGASQPAAYGDYFAWGETKPKTDYSEYTYKYGSDSENPTKYNSKDGKTTLDSKDDAATANWGSKCRMPSRADFRELRNNCSWVWQSDYNGTSGYLVTGANGNYIFLPAADRRMATGSIEPNEWGFYWSSTVFHKGLDYGGAYNLFFRFRTGKFDKLDENAAYSREEGFSVRPVVGKTNNDYEDSGSGNNNGNSDGSNSSGSTGGGGSTSYEKPDIALEDYTTYPTKIKVNYRIYNQDKAKVTSAKVYYGTSSPSKSISTTVAGTLITTYISGLKKGTTYYVKCIATGKGGSTTSETTRIITDF